MIRKAKFENFKGLRDVEITFESRFTVLVGPNGTGKTSVLQGVELVANASMQEIPLHGLFLWRSGGPDKTLRAALMDDTGTGYSAEDAPPLDPQHRGPRPVARQTFQVANGGVVRNLPNMKYQQPAFGPVLRPAFLSSQIALSSVTTSSPPAVETTGKGLPALLGYLKLRDDELFDRVEACLCAILPHIRKLRIDESGNTGGALPKSLLFDTVYQRKVPASDMSDGTLYILALIVAVLGPHRPKTLLLDDIDMRLHPKAQYELVTLLKKFLDEFPDLQIIATSHSPYILDRLELNEVLVTDLADDGSVIIAPLTAHPSYEKWKDAVTPGEFWSSTGEGWLRHLKREPTAP